MFPMLSTETVVVGNVRKYRKSAFNLATRNADEHSQLISKSDKESSRELQWPATVNGNRIPARTENRNHKVSLTSQALDDSLAEGSASWGPLVALGGAASI
jgi:hypothetical protein